MADNKEAQLEKLEADRQKHVDAIARLDDQIKSIRAELRSSKLAEAKKQAADYGFTATELFGTSVANAAKPKAKRGEAKTVRYRNENGDTWGGGKGPRPGWIKAIKDAGGDIEKYRVAA